jgi:carboxymethylenebutenolidase
MLRLFLFTVLAALTARVNLRPRRLLSRPVLTEMTLRFVATLCAAGMLLAVASPTRQASAQPAASVARPPVVSATGAPAGTEAFATEWVTVAVPGVGVMLAAIARPSGAGPFPSVLVLHGTHGFAQQYVQMAQDLAARGLLAVVACWFSGGGGNGSRFVTPPIPCPEAPPMPAMTNAESVRAAVEVVDALVQATGGLPGVRADRLGLIGHSRGGGAAMNYVLQLGGVQAVVVHSGGYGTQPADHAARFNVPVLILHGTADSPANGGNAVTNVRMAREFEAALRREGKPVEAIYYDGGGHDSFFENRAQYDDELTNMVAFLRRHLSR